MESCQRSTEACAGHRGAVVTITDITQHVILIQKQKTKEEERKTERKNREKQRKLQGWHPNKLQSCNCLVFVVHFASENTWDKMGSQSLTLGSWDLFLHLPCVMLQWRAGAKTLGVPHGSRQGFRLSRGLQRDPGFKGASSWGGLQRPEATQRF